MAHDTQNLREKNFLFLTLSVTQACSANQNRQRVWMTYGLVLSLWSFFSMAMLRWEDVRGARGKMLYIKRNAACSIRSFLDSEFILKF